uniref:Protein Wnt n=1 Tax=Phallusia mammillata TaxID=59560 RepID=A0A6F9DXJ2_9ASCI|nr:Wnt14/15 [Phallusia mammillata]
MLTSTVVQVLFVQFTAMIVSCDGYFGLTGKGQLRNLWDIQASSLAAATNLDGDTENPGLPEPSRDYKPVNLSPIPKDRSKGASDSYSKIDGHDGYRSEYTKVPSSGGRRNYRTHHSQKSSTLPPTRRVSPGDWKRPPRRYPQSTVTSHTHQPRDTQAAINRRHQTTWASRRRHPTDGQSKNGTEVSRRIVKLMSGDLGRVRSERESGKKRDLNKAHLNSYIVSTSFTNAQIPSRVAQFDDARQYVADQSLLSANRTSENATSRFTTNSEPFLGLDEDSFASYTAFMKSKFGNFTPLVEPRNIDRRAARRMCNNFALTASQLKKCRRDPGMPQVLSEATHIAAAECQYQFRYEKWNCSLGSSRIKMLDKGTKETAFLYSISSAGLTHTVARACANGYLTRCSCEANYPGVPKNQAWMWGGCGDNVRYAARFVRKFLRSRHRNKDVRARVNQHNSDVGIRIVKSNVGQACKCHGVSGSCTTETCWRKMVPFDVIGKKVKRAYDKAVKVGGVNNANGVPNLIRRGRAPNKRLAVTTQLQLQRVRQHNANVNNRPNHTPPPQENPKQRKNALIGNPKNKEMVFLESSPSYCSKTKYSLGTKGRICNKKKDCDRICCGRGYTTHVRIIRRSCNCQVQWCCYVQCAVCTDRKVINTCL